MSDPTEREVSAGLRVAVELARENAEAVEALRARVAAVAEALAARGVASLPATESAGPFSRYDIAPTLRPEAPHRPEDDPDVDCVALFPICNARCCRFSFPLTRAEVERGVVRWDPRRPYFIRQGPGHRCVHQGERGACGVYADRPTPCRVYDCRDDPRIWVDFDRKIPRPDDEGPSRMDLPLRWLVRDD